MDQILQQLLDLLLPLFWGALPTVLIVFFLFFFLRWAFWRPFERVLAWRQAAPGGGALAPTRGENLPRTGRRAQRRPERAQPAAPRAPPAGSRESPPSQ